MNSLLRGGGLSGLRGWHVSLALFLAFLVPVTPLLAEVYNDASRHSTQQPPVSPEHPVVLHEHVPSYYIALDLLGRHHLLDPATAWFLSEAGASACEVGRNDANREVEGTFWFILSTLISIWGVVLAYIITPSVPDSNLKGKSGSYTTSYTQCYQDKAQAIHVKWSWYGALSSLALWSIVFFIIWAASGGGMSN